MKINVKEVLMDLGGKPLKAGPEQTDFMLRDACVTALTTAMPGEQMSGPESFKRYKLALVVSGDGVDGDGVVNLSSEDVSLIKTLVGKLYAPLVVGRVYDALDK